MAFRMKRSPANSSHTNSIICTRVFLSMTTMPGIMLRSVLLVGTDIVTPMRKFLSHPPVEYSSRSADPAELSYPPLSADEFAAATQRVWNQLKKLRQAHTQPSTAVRPVRSAETMGIVSASWLWRNLRYSILVIFMIAGIISPAADILNMWIFAAPMVGLYLLSIAIVWAVDPKRRKTANLRGSTAY
jgi:hypothetical protein